MKRICLKVIWFFLLALLLCGTVSAAELPVWGSIQEDTAILYLLGAEEDVFTCQVGNAEATVTSTTPVRTLETPVETVILIDNSRSIQSDQRPVIKELLEDLIANRLSGERYTIATVSDQVDYLCTDEKDYTTLKSTIDNLEFQDQNTQLTDGLYSVLTTLKGTNNGTFRRLLIIADGVDNKQVGYTRSELTSLIQEMGYPIYTVGCTNNTASATEELQNLFELSRLTPGSFYYLSEVERTMDIVSGVTSWNNSIQLKVQFPLEVCDGLPRVLRVTSGNGTNDVYSIELTMPLAALPEPTEEPVLEPPVQVTEPEPTPEPKASLPWGRIILIAALVVAAVVIVVVAVILLQKKKKGERIVVNPEAKPPVEAPGVTEFLSADSEDYGKTEGIWDSASRVRLVFQNLDQSGQRIETMLNGEVIVGRDATACQVVLTEPSVARKQCRIFQQSNWVMLENLSRSNITKLNGRVVTETCELSSGDTLQMGRLRMRVDILET